MDSTAYLQRHGWRGHGYSLDQHGKGIKKPLLVSKRVDALGLGLNKHQAVSDQWWLRAFDQGLKDLGSGKQSVLASVQKHGIHRGGLYGRFVKGGEVPGTIGISATSSEPPTPPEVRTPGDTEKEGTKDTTGDSKLKGKGEDKQAVRERRKYRKLNKEQKQDVNSNIRSQIDRQCKEILHEAVRRGFIPPSSKETKKGIVPRGGAVCWSENDLLSTIISSAGLEFPASITGPSKTQEIERVALKRTLKRAAKAHFLKERQISVQSIKKSTERARQEVNIASAVSDQTSSEPLSKKRRREEVESTLSGPNTVVQQANDNVNEFESGVDKIRLKRKKRSNSPGEGIVSRYSTRAEKKVKKAAKSAAAVTTGEDCGRAKEDAFLAKKMSQYEQRAREKGMSVEIYIQRRQEKKTAKYATVV